MSTRDACITAPVAVVAASGAGATATESDRNIAIAAPSRDDVKAALVRILASTTFRHSARHRAFLRYVVDNTLAGRARTVKEVVIGLDVFDRALDGFDPRRDSIVRVEARRLRKKLRAYYGGEGSADQVEIRLDVGSYVPAFSWRLRTPDARMVTPLVLVVPFVTLDDRHAGIVASGLCDQLTDVLGSIGGIRVMSTVASWRSRLQVDGRDNLVVGDGLDYVVDGSVTHKGSRWRCIAHLTSMRDGIRRWSRSFDFGAADDGASGRGDGSAEVGVDLIELQDRVAAALHAAMRSELERID
jgi:TolB-like protein